MALDNSPTFTYRWIRSSCLFENCGRVDGAFVLGRDWFPSRGEFLCVRLDRFSIVKEDQSSMSKDADASWIRFLKPGVPEFSSGEVKSAIGKRMNFFQC